MVLQKLRSVVDGKEFLLALSLFFIAWLLVLISVCPIAWYKARTTTPCDASYEGKEVETKFVVTLWRYHSCNPVPLACSNQCTNKRWSELWKIGCGGVGPQGEELYCYNFDSAGEMTAAFLVLGLCISSLVFPLSFMRLKQLNVKFLSQVRIGKILLVVMSFCWACCIMSFVWYPYIADAKSWEEQNGGTMHLGVGWYLVLTSLPLFFISIVFFVLDFAKVSNRQSYEETREEETF